MVDEEGELLFVYGTLMRGYENHPLLQGSRLVGLAAVIGLALYVNSLPFVVEGEAAGDYVIGELYAVRPPVLGACDRLEGHPHFYRRARCVARLPDGSERPAWYYHFNRQLPPGLERCRSYRAMRAPRTSRSRQLLDEVRQADFESLLF